MWDGRLAPANPSHASCASSPTLSVPTCALTGACCSATEDTLQPRRPSGKCAGEWQVWVLGGRVPAL